MHTLERLGIADGLGKDFAYRGDALRATLVGMAGMAGAELTVAIVKDRVVGFLLVDLPHQQTRWGRAKLEGLYEIAALEVARPWRGQGIGSGLLRAATTAQGDEWILLAPLDPEEWDMLGTGLSKTAYRQMLMSLFRNGGFAVYPRSLDPGLSHDPLSLFLVRVGARVNQERLRHFEALLGTAGPRSLLQINALLREEREAIYRRLIPGAIFTTFAIDARSWTDSAGNRLVELYCPPDQDMVWIGVRGRSEDNDWCYLIKLHTTVCSSIELGLVIIGDPRSERFNIDRDPEGRDTRLGTMRRNIPEEIRAMRAGLAPGQTRQGLRFLKETVRLVEEFVGWMGHDLFVLDALFYHNAILYERYGFGYTMGQREMERIQREFQPGGEVYARLDGSTPFRRPGAERTVRSRSWAIHDGILEKPWQPPRMYKRVGKYQGVCTFPGGY